MAIAIKKELAHTRYAGLSRRLAGEKRTGLKLTCPLGACGQEYVVYFGTANNEEEMRWLFDRRVSQHHPYHHDLYAFDEPLPQCGEPEAHAVNGECTLTPKMIQQGKASGVLARTSRVFAGCLAFVVAAVPIATRGSSLIAPK